ncbi:hypothetical protein [Nocardiopsis potens]|uniref:hypothetical protein n=1 Tax=Nocardiopsis potens TaxID=1246458 RepID=UPI00037D31F5|nr:hypothetical protein [Nocardiopsis potens]
MRWPARLALAAVLVALVVYGAPRLGIDLPFAPREDGLDEARAGELAEKHLADAVAALPGGAEMEPGGAESAVGSPCADRDLVAVAKRYSLDSLPAEESKEAVDALVTHWSINGYTVQEDLRPDEPFVSVRDRNDEFQLSVHGGSGEDGEFSISASSPCIGEEQAEGGWRLPIPEWPFPT